MDQRCRAYGGLLETSRSETNKDLPRHKLHGADPGIKSQKSTVGRPKSGPKSDPVTSTSWKDVALPCRPGIGPRLAQVPGSVSGTRPGPAVVRTGDAAAVVVGTVLVVVTAVVEVVVVEVAEVVVVVGGAVVVGLEVLVGAVVVLVVVVLVVVVGLLVEVGTDEVVVTGRLVVGADVEVVVVGTETSTGGGTETCCFTTVVVVGRALVVVGRCVVVVRWLRPATSGKLTGLVPAVVVVAAVVGLCSEAVVVTALAGPAASAACSCRFLASRAATSALSLFNASLCARRLAPGGRVVEGSPGTAFNVCATLLMIWRAAPLGSCLAAAASSALRWAASR